MAEAVAVARAHAGGVRPAFVCLLVTTPFAGALEVALREAGQAAEGAPLLGAVVDSVMAGGEEVRDAAAAALVVAGIEADVFVEPASDARHDGGGPWLDAAFGAPAPADLLLTFFDPLGGDPIALARALGAAAGPALVIGAGVADAGDGASRVFAGGEVSRGGIAGAWLRAAGPPRVRVTASCRPCSGPHRVTRVDGNWIVSLDGRPALDVYRDAARARLAEDLRRATEFVVAVLPASPDRPPTPSEGRVRHVCGVSEARRAFALAEVPARGASIGFAFRDAGAARDDLRTALDELATKPAAFGLHVACRERGESLFGVEGLEAAYLERALPGVALLGLGAACEIAPVAGAPTLVTHAAATVLVGG